MTAAVAPHDRSGRRRWRAVVALVGAVLVAAAAMVVAWSLDRDEVEKPSRLEGIDIADLARPSALTDAERRGDEDEEGSSGDLARPGAVELAEGGWIEVADETGRLRQRYSAARMDPLPDRWMQMDEPRAHFFAADGRVTRVGGRSGTARIPDREIESGTLSGEVRIEVFRPVDDEAIDLESTQPWATVAADEIDFDGSEGRIRGDGAVSVRSPELSFDGEGMLLFLDPSGREIERLVVERATGPLVLTPKKRDSQPAAGPSPDPPTERAAAAPAAAAGSRPSPQATAANATAASQPAQPASPNAAPTKSDRLFQLRLEGGVLVSRLEGESRSTVRGDRLTAVFAMQQGGFAELAANGPESSHRAVAAIPVELWIAAGSLAASPQASGPSGGVLADDADRIEIEFGGSLVLEPLAEGEPGPTLPKELWVRIDGAPVEIEDPEREASVRCSVLEARTGSQAGDRIDLTSPEGVTTIETPTLKVQSPAIRVAGRAIGLDGPGEVRFFARDREASASEDAVESEVPRQRETIAISWRTRLDLALAEDERSIESARFEGGPHGVMVEAETLHLEAASLEATFFPRGESDSRDRLRRFLASGGVRAVRRGGIGGMWAEAIDVELRDDPASTSVERFEATGAVRALDAQRLVYADRLEASFLAVASAEPSPEVAAGEGVPGEQLRGEAEPGATAVDAGQIDQARAEGEVVVALADGTWAFADRLEGDGPQSKLRLEGSDGSLLIARDQAVVDRFESLVLEDGAAARLANGTGPGRLRAGSEAAIEGWSPPTEVQLTDTEWSPPPRPTRPEPRGALELMAVWTDGLDFAEPRADPEEAAPPPATLEIRGGVRARAIGERGREDRLDADSIRVRFRPQETGSEDGESSLEPMQLVARGAPATLEARRPPDTAVDAAEASELDLFRITGPEIEYDLDDREGRVPGAGTMLVSEAAVGDDPASISRFRWKGRLDLVSLAPGRSKVTLADEVELARVVRATDTAAGEQFTVTAARMEAIVADADPKGPDASAPPDEARMASSELLAVRGFGRVFARGGGRDIECDAFDYDAETGVVVLTARPGRSVSVLERGAAGPVRASRVEWNVRTGRVEVLDGRGEG